MALKQNEGVHILHEAKSARRILNQKIDHLERWAQILTLEAGATFSR